MDSFSGRAENSAELLVVRRRAPNPKLDAVAGFLEQDGVIFDPKMRAKVPPKLFHGDV